MTDLILQKVLRVKQIENNQGATLVSEGVDANYQDMVNYAVFALIHSVCVADGVRDAAWPAPAVPACVQGLARIVRVSPYPS